MATRLTVKEAANALGMSESRIKILCKEGRLPAEKFGSRWVVKGLTVKPPKPKK